jgi:hypothetical protein
VLSENRTANELVLRVEAPSGTTHRLVVRINGPAAHNLKVEGASLQAEELVVQFSGRGRRLPGENNHAAMVAISFYGSAYRRLDSLR